MRRSSPIFSATTSPELIPRQNGHQPRRIAPTGLDLSASGRGFVTSADWISSSAREVLERARHERRPAGLMARPDTSASIGVKVLVEEHEVTPVRVGAVAVVAVVNRAPPARIRQERARETGGDLARDLLQVHHPPRACRALDAKRVGVELVVALERLD